MAVVALVAVRSALREQGRQLPRLQEIEVGPFGSDRLVRKTDVDDVHAAAHFFGGREDVGQLGSDERDSVVRPDARPGDIVGVARQTAGNVDRHDAGARVIHVLDDRREESLHGARQPGPQNSIHDQIAPLQEFPGRPPLALARDFAGRFTEPLQGPEVNGGASVHVPPVAEQDGGEGDALIVQVPRQDESVAPVVPPSA